MSGKLAPSKSTVYVGNLPYSLTNSDLHKIFEKYGKVVKVTIIKDKETRESKGSAFVLYLERESAHKAVAAVNKKQMFGRTVKCAIAKDNGRAAEFIRRRDYPDKSRCYECGEYGHLSYCCPKNMLGDREQPKKKEKKRKRRKEEEDEEVDAEEEEYSDDGEDPYEYSLSAVIAECASLAEEQDQERHKTSSGGIKKRKVIQKDTYFSDEDASD